MFANVLKDLRTSKNLSQEELGNIIGVSKSTIGMYEQGNRIPKADATLKKLAKFFNVSIDYLMGLSDEEKPSITKSSDDINLSLTKHEKKVIKEYRAKPEMQPAVDKLLGIMPENNVSSIHLSDTPYVAAQSGKEIKAGIPDLEDLIELEKSKQW